MAIKFKSKACDEREGVPRGKYTREGCAHCIHRSKDAWWRWPRGLDIVWALRRLARATPDVVWAVSPRRFSTCSAHVAKMSKGFFDMSYVQMIWESRLPWCMCMMESAGSCYQACAEHFRRKRELSAAPDFTSNGPSFVGTPLLTSRFQDFHRNRRLCRS